MSPDSPRPPASDPASDPASAPASAPHAAPTPPAAPKPGFRRDIQGLRAVAVLMVMLFHAGLPVSGGFAGVDVFFVISGVVITSMLLREHRAHGGIRLLRFYLRRFLRLTPALAVMVVVVMAVSTLLVSPIGVQEATAKTGLGALLLIANLVLARASGNYFETSAEANPLLNTWSLSVEEQFYLLFPFVMVLAWRTGVRLRHRGTVAVVLLGGASLALAVASLLGHPLPLPAGPWDGLADPFYSPLTRAWEFAAGAALALVPLHLSRRTADVAGVAGLVALAFTAAAVTGAMAWPGPWTFVPVIATVLVIAAGAGEGLTRRLLSARWLVWVGDRSYSIYLWHWPVIVFAHSLFHGAWWAGPVAAVVSLLPAWASYRWVEEPLRHLQVSSLPRFGAVVAAVSGPPLALSGALLVAADRGWWSPTVREHQVAAESYHPAFSAGCSTEFWLPQGGCRWNASADGPPVYLLGDSNADHFSAGLVDAAREAGRPVDGLIEYGCGVVPSSLTNYDAQREQRCADYLTAVDRQLREAEPGLVVIANSYLEASDRVEPGQAPTDLSLPEQADLVEADLVARVREYRSLGHQVVLVQPVPRFGVRQADLDWHACTLTEILGGRCEKSISEQQFQRDQGAVLRAVDEAGQIGGAEVLDLSPELREGQDYPAVRADGTVQYRDGTHLSITESHQLAPVWQQVLARHG